jgi:hypothetical protein
MKHLIITLTFVITLTTELYSQPISYTDRVESLYKQTIRDFNEVFLIEIGLTMREYFSCPDTINKSNCKLTRRIYFNSNGNIYSDTSFIDTLTSVTTRLYESNKITITKCHPEPSLFKYIYKTSTDSLIIDSLARPVKFYRNGVLNKNWQFDVHNRLLHYVENPQNESVKKEILYNYSSDTIIEIRISRFFSKLDTIYNFYHFDNKSRLIKETSQGKSIKYKSKGSTIYFDSIENVEIYPLQTEVEYLYLSDSIIKVTDSRLNIVQFITLDQNFATRRQQMFKNDTILIGEYIFHRTNSIVRVEKYNEEGHYSTEIRYLRDGEKIQCIKKYLWGEKNYEEECYSKSGMILKKLIMKEGNIFTNLITNDSK